MNRHAVVGLAVALTPLTALAGDAAPKPPIKKSYDVQEPVPYPLSLAQGNGCEDGPADLSKHVEPFTLPAAGTLVIELSGFVGDWDLILQKDGGGNLAESAADNSTNTGGAKEKITYKKGKAGAKVSIVACNWSGGPTGHVDYTFTFAK